MTHDSPTPDEMFGGVSEMRQIGERLKRLREEHRLSQQALGDLSGLGQTEISKIETGKRKLTLDKAVRLAPHLGAEVTDLLPSSFKISSTIATSPSSAPQPAGARMGLPQRGVIPNERTLPVRGTAQGGAGRVHMMAENRPVDWTYRPQILEGVTEAYALFVFDDSMSPVFKHGHTLWVHPYLVPGPGDAVVVVLKDDAVLVKELVRRTGSSVALKEYNPDERQFEVDAEDVRFIHMVVGSLRR